LRYPRWGYRCQVRVDYFDGAAPILMTLAIGAMLEMAGFLVDCHERSYLLEEAVCVIHGFWHVRPR